MIDFQKFLCIVVGMYVTEIPNRNSRPATLLRQSYRQDGKVKTQTLANLSHWPKQKIEALRRLLRGDTLVSPEDVFTVEASLPHGHVELRKMSSPSKLPCRMAMSSSSSPRCESSAWTA